MLRWHNEQGTVSMPAADYISMLETELAALRKAVRCMHQQDTRFAARLVTRGTLGWCYYASHVGGPWLVARPPGGYCPSCRSTACSQES